MRPATILEHDGIKQPIIEWALDYGITPAIIIARLERGTSIAEAITTPMVIGHCNQQLPIFHRKQRTKAPKELKRPRTVYTFNGKTMSINGWAREVGINAATLRHRIETGWPLALALSTEPTANRSRRKSMPGVASNLEASEGTGARSVSQAMSHENNFSGNPACQQ